MSGRSESSGPRPGPEPSRRDFLSIAAGALGVAGIAAAAWPFIEQMTQARQAAPLATVELDLAPVAPGQRVTVRWRGQPIFIDHRTPAEIEAARAVPLGHLRDPQSDAERVQRPEWLVVIGVCTHRGCALEGQDPGSPRGDYGGWLCACDGSHYDTSGRVRRGPALRNLAVPPYAFVADRRIRIG